MKRSMMKTMVLLAAAIVTLTVVAGSTVAYLIASDGPLTNTFTPPSSGVTVVETLSSGEKTEVKVTNTADYPVYVRAKVTIWWEAKEGYPAKNVSSSEYTSSINTTDWTLDGGFYYYNNIVEANAQTTNLINSIKPNAEAGVGYIFHVDIAAQTIQAEGMGVNTAQDAFLKAANTGTTAE